MIPAVEGWQGRFRMHRWTRHAMWQAWERGGTDWMAWAWLLSPLKMPGGCYVSTTPYEVRA